MIKVKDSLASREPIPAAFMGLDPVSLLDLSWADPSYGVEGAAWWPEESADGELGTNKKWGAEVLTLDADRKVVVVTHKQVAMTAAEKAARDAAIAADWAQRIADRRYAAEVGGTTVSGMQIVTDDRSKLLINGAAARAARDTTYTLRWKTPEGFVDLNAAQVLAVADAVSDHVQNCFDRESALIDAVADGSITAEMLEQGWP